MLPLLISHQQYKFSTPELECKLKTNHCELHALAKNLTRQQITSLMNSAQQFMIVQMQVHFLMTSLELVMPEQSFENCGKSHAAEKIGNGILRYLDRSPELLLNILLVSDIQLGINDID